MPCTIQVGQLVCQLAYNGRVWRLVRQYDDGRWAIICVTPGLSDARRPGETCIVTERWLDERCVDFVAPTIDPPCGDGPQTVRALCNGEFVEDSLFTTSIEMSAFVTDYLTVDADDNDALSIEWYGWDAVGQEGTADLTATVVDGEISWSEG